MQYWKRAVPCMKSARTAAKMKEGIDQLLANKVLFSWLFCWKNVIEYQPKLSLFVMTNIGHSNLSAKLGKYGILNIIHPLFDILDPDVSLAHRLFDLGWSRRKVLQLPLQVFNLFTWLIHLIRRLGFVCLCVLQSRFQPWKFKKKKSISYLLWSDYTFKEATLFSCECDKRNLFTLNLETDGMQLWFLPGFFHGFPQFLA